jgi:hypothetical protein
MVVVVVQYIINIPMDSSIHILQLDLLKMNLQDNLELHLYQLALL